MCDRVQILIWVQTKSSGFSVLVLSAHLQSKWQIHIFAKKYFIDGIHDKNSLDKGLRVLWERLYYSRSVIRICANWCPAEHKLVISERLREDTVTG